MKKFQQCSNSTHISISGNSTHISINSTETGDDTILSEQKRQQEEEDKKLLEFLKNKNMILYNMKTGAIIYFKN